VSFLELILTTETKAKPNCRRECAFGWPAHSRNSKPRLFTEDTQIRCDQQ